MILTTHILSGALIGAEIKNQFFIVIISVVVHFLLDLFPHGDYLNKKSGLREFWKVAVDLAIGFTVLAVAIFIRGLTSNSGLNMGNIGLGIFFSLLPDGTTFLYIYMKMKFLKPVKVFHEKMHLHPDFSPEREFRLRNGFWEILISFAPLLALILI